MLRITRTFAGALLCAAVLPAAGCTKGPTGPSLSAVSVTGITPENLKPTAGSAATCCCRATGRATNQNSVPVHVSLKIAGYDSAGTDPLSTVFYFIPELQPNASHDIDASGFVVPCDAIKQLKIEVDVRGTTGP
jgi:hypothetical protein